MELRSCIHLHFINSLKGGLVIKALNVNRGKPLLKFKTLKDIYETEDEKNQNQDDEFEGFLFDRIKVERPTVSDSEFSCNEDDGGSNSDLDDLGTGKMTQKQNKETCKAKKRKRSKFADSINDELCSHVKQDADEDEFDPMEPLITWKAKLSKKVKGKARCLENQVYVPLQSPMSIVKSEQIPSDEDFVGSTESLPLLVNVKVEALETDYSDSQVIIGDSSSLYDDQVDSFRASQSSTEAVEMATDCILKTQALCSERGDIICFVDDSSLIHGDKVDSCRVVLNEVSKTDAESEALNSLIEGHQPSVISQEQHEDANSEPFVVVNCQVDSRGTVPREVTEIASELFLGTEKLTSEIEEPHLCAVNEVCYDYVEHDYSEPVQRISASCADVKKGDIVEAKDGQDLVFPVLEYEGEGCIDKPLCAGIYQEVMLPNCDNRSDVSDALPSPANRVLPCDIDSSPKVQSPDDATYGCFQDIESNVGSDACTLDDGDKDDLPSILETVALYCSDGEFSLASNSCFLPSPEDSPTTEEKQYQSSSTCDGAETNCLPQTLGCDAHDELTTSDGDGNCFSNLDPPPQRLLSTRKAISPDSQEKLCMAMESVEIHKEEHYRSQKKLCFGQQNGKETKVNKAERPGSISKIRFSVNQKQDIPKLKHDKRNGKTNVDPKGPHPSNAVPRFTTGCNSIESCSQSAIAFSQRQMQDIECLTTKLTNELKTMKEIAEDRLYSETSTSLKYKANEVRMAIKSARKVEQLANKWLSMMARDCNRFCKIMGLAEKDSDAAETGGIANKERKKITFADEAGAELCHVKFFEKNLTESSPKPDATRPEVQS